MLVFSPSSSPLSLGRTMNPHFLSAKHVLHSPMRPVALPQRYCELVRQRRNSESFDSDIQSAAPALCIVLVACMCECPELLSLSSSKQTLIPAALNISAKLSCRLHSTKLQMTPSIEALDLVSKDDDKMIARNDDGNCNGKPIINIWELPSELIRQVYSFMDIPMLGSMSQLHRGVLRRFANEELRWNQLVRKRFQIATTAKRPKTYGGLDWKHAYRSLHMCNRMPKSRWTNHKAIFAKSSQSSSSVSSSLAAWVTLYHTENCRTRVLRTSNNENALIPRRNYVDLWVCLQNTRSNGPAIKVDINDCELQFIGDLGNIVVEPCLQTKDLQYRVLHKQSNKKMANTSKRATSKRATRGTINKDNNVSAEGYICLKSWEFCVVSIPFACGTDVFETDVLARTLSLRVPYLTGNNDASGNNAGLSEAFFISENDVWDRYCELPGGCLTLTDRERRLHL